MRYRKLDPNGDYTLFAGQQDFYINQPAAVAQAVETRLKLWLGEWFVDTTDGTNWQTGVLGKYTQSTRDAVIKARILATKGVNRILTYSSNFNSATRTFDVNVSLDTVYGVVPSYIITGIPISGSQPL